MKSCSYSKLNLYDGCPAAYNYHYNLNLPEPPSEALMEGSVVHAAIAAYNRHLLKNHLETDITAVAELTRQAWATETHSLPATKLAEVEQIMAGFAGSHALDYGTVVGVEEWFRGLKVGGTDFRGIRDLVRITGKIGRVTDYKSSWAAISQADADRDPQLSTYAWATAREYPQLERIVADLDFVRHGIIRTVEFNLEQIARIEERLATQIARIDADHLFSPTPGAQCSLCGYPDRCEAVKQLRDGRILIASREDAIRVGGELALLEKQVADRKKVLQGYCNQAGSIVAGGLEWGFLRTESRTVEDLGAFRRLLAAHDLNPDEYLRVDALAAKRLWDKPDLGPGLEQIAVDRSYTAFRSRKVKGGDAA